MSNLIKAGDHPRFRIASFEAEEMKGKQAPGTGRGSSLSPAGVGMRPSGADAEEGGGLEDRVAEIEREAYEKGFEQGHKDGLALGEKRMEQTLKQMEELLKGLGVLKKGLFLESERELLELSVEIARQVTKEEIKQDPQVVVRSIRSALAFLADKSHVRVLISPEDAKEVQRFLPNLAESFKVSKFQLTEDKSIQRGGCMIETGFGRINATLEDQFAEMRKMLAQEFRARVACGDGPEGGE